MRTGDKICAKNTITNLNCGLIYRLSSGYITLVDDNKISFYLEKNPGSGLGYFDAYCSPETFAMNFELSPYPLNNIAYKKSVHAIRKFPDHFFIK